MDGLCYYFFKSNIVIPQGHAPISLRIVIMIYRMVSQVYIRWWAYMFIRPESLRVEGQEPDFVHVMMHIINIKKKHLCVWTDHDE